MIIDTQQNRKTLNYLIKSRPFFRTSRPHPCSLTHTHLTSTQLSSSKFELQNIPIPTDDVLSPSDIFDGVLIALALAFVATALQGRRNQTDFYLPDISGGKTSINGTNDNDTENRIVFDSESWKEISQPDNYILYNQKLKARKNASSSSRTEKKWVILALLLFFVPIFSVEFFFALSRQLVCDGDIMNRPEWAEYLCSPVNL